MRVVNLFGGPCSGKSTVMAGLFWMMRCSGVNVEMAPEWIKDAVFSGDGYPFHDQQFVFANQRKRLKQLEGKVDWAITDSPLLLSHIYGDSHTVEFSSLIDSEFDYFDNINFFLHRTMAYVTVGRRESEESAKAVDKKVLKVLHGRDYQSIISDAFTPKRIFEQLHVYGRSNL